MNSNVLFGNSPVDLNSWRDNLQILRKFFNPLPKVLAVLACNIIRNEQDNKENPRKGGENKIVNIDISMLDC